MNVFTRGVRNAFRNGVRTGSIVLILGLSIGLSLTMLVAHRAVGQKIASVKSSIGNTITVTPAGVNGFEGGGNPLTSAQISQISSLAHVVNTNSSINDRLTTSNTSLVSAIDAGSLGRRFFSNANGNGRGNFGGFGGGDNGNAIVAFTPPVSALGTTDPSMLDGSAITLKSGKQISGTTDTDAALIGSSLATKNNLTVGSTFTAYGTTISVAGIFDTGTGFSNNTVIFALPTLQRLSSQTGDVTSATLTVDTLSNVNSVVSAVKSKLGSAADVASSEASATTALAPLQSVQNVSLYSLIGAIIAGGVIILLTMVMIVRERKREIGVAKAIGASNIRVMSEFMVESFTLTILGAVIGLLIGVIGGQPVTKTLVKNSTNMSDTSIAAPAAPEGGGFGGRSTGGFRNFTHGIRNNGAIKGLDNINAEIGWGILLDGFGAAILIAAIGSTLAAGMIAKVRPSEVMRVE